VENACEGVVDTIPKKLYFWLDGFSGEASLFGSIWPKIGPNPGNESG